jgi:hypothetical protein
MPEIISSVRALENGDEIGQLNGDSRNDDQIKSITDRIMKKKPKAAIRDTAESSELVERKKDDDDPSSYIIEAFYSKDVPFYIADLKTTDEEKLEWILIEKSAFESLTQFAEVYMDIFDCVKDVQKRYLQIFDLWKLYTRSTGKEVKITKRADLDPKTQSELLWIVEGVDQGLCLECGKKCDEKFCSVRCEAAGKKLKCSTPGCSSKVFDRGVCNHILCGECGNVVATTVPDTGRVKKRILNPHEIQIDENHVQAWKNRKKAST